MVTAILIAGSLDSMRANAGGGSSSDGSVVWLLLYWWACCLGSSLGPERRTPMTEEKYVWSPVASESDKLKES
jgi:hypothetical protein